MDREIFFRVWHKKIKQMFYECEGFFYKDGSWDFSIPNVGGDSDDILPMQYTGFKDKNGRKIYEGDILKSITENLGNMKCVFENGSFVLYNNFGRWGLLSRCFDADITEFYQIEVIGNIYEN